ncbi:copper resistance CopC family protein [Fodinicola acaciae]|uniref:copper resistance CopC family protein n=1 Tax=Fodinicola acaciae TaxID=2681555 RepID=UPI0013D3ED94|nr:copper resistance CopC family protein [Fodinicola acaciae]
MRLALRFLVLLAAIAGLAVTAPAYAHDVLVSSTPASGASVPAPRMVTFVFNDVVLNKFAAVVVTGPDGKQYQDGAPRVVDTSVSVNVKPLSAKGAYTASYRIVSADGHPVSGDITFTVTSTTPGSLDPNAPGVTQTTAPPAAAASGGDATPWVIGIGVAILVLALGAVFLATRRRQPVEQPEPIDDNEPAATGPDSGRTAE